MTDITTQAQQAATFWGGFADAPRLIRNRENAVFEVTLQTGQRAALRLHRQGYQTHSAIEAELTWTLALAQSGFPCPRPIAAKDGRTVQTLAGGRLVSMVTWIDARPIGENAVPFKGSLEQQQSLYTRLGALIAQLHARTDQLGMGALDRPSWGRDGLLGDQPLWGRFWENSSLTAAEQALLKRARDHAAKQLQAIPELQETLIHADLIQENVLQNAQGLHIIDFDDSGFGYKLYDLGAALIQHAESPDLDALTKALCAGYGCDTSLMSLFIMLRAMASCGWIMSRAPATDPKQRFYAARALNCAQRYLSSHV